jgi:hypothetical protein
MARDAGLKWGTDFQASSRYRGHFFTRRKNGGWWPQAGLDLWAAAGVKRSLRSATPAGDSLKCPFTKSQASKPY